MFGPSRSDRVSRRVGIGAFWPLLVALGMILATAPRGGVLLAGATTNLLASRDSDPVPPAIATGAAIYKSECAVCHGKGGKGDGPVAVALRPPPADLTDTARLAKLSDDSLVQVITYGRRGMPSFKDDLTPSQILQVVAFIRRLRPPLS